MSDQILEDRDKVDEYLRVIQERILAPIEKTEIQSSCTATLLLLFAAIDGLGKLYHPSDKAKVTKRIEKFLEYMGGDYADNKKQLSNLRHSLVHNAINVESYLSKTEMTSDQHLKKIGAAGFIYVNTKVFYKDFVVAFKRFSDDIQDCQDLRKRAADRLDWREDDHLDKLDITGDATPSPPPPVEFIYAKEIRSATE
jgi:hypothetical protein